MNILKKINTVLKILKEDGFKTFLKVLASKVSSPIVANAVFRRISKAASKELDKNEEVFRALINGAAYVYGMGVQGDIAEFGTMTGRSAVALAVAVKKLNRKYSGDSRGAKKAWFFDSFEGLPEARFEIDKQSQHVSSGVWGKGTCKGLDQTAFHKHLSNYLDQKDFFVISGWFKDTVPNINPSQKFSLIHIDGDLYESAIDVLDALFRKQMISSGAIIFFDDWNCNAADPDIGERRAWAEVCEKYNIVFSDASSYGIASHKFIIHKYSQSF
jgi:predicted O-methyltransferase YrrM